MVRNIVFWMDMGSKKLGGGVLGAKERVANKRKNEITGRYGAKAEGSCKLERKVESGKKRGGGGRKRRKGWVEK